MSFQQYRCNSEFSVFQTFRFKFIILFWDICDLLDRVCWPRCWFVSDKTIFFGSVGSSLSPLLLICVWQTKFIQYCWMLLDSKKSLNCKILTLKCFSKMANCELIDARPLNAARCLLEDGEARRWQNVTSWLQVPDTTVRAKNITQDDRVVPSFVKSRERLAHYKHISLLFQQQFFVLVCIHPGNPRVPPLLLASGPKPCGGNKFYAHEHHCLFQI